MKKRMAAEWEPAVGVLVAWPASLPQALLVKLTNDTNVHFLCADEEATAEAAETLSQMGANLENVSYLIVPKGDDSTWPRDWGPQPLFDEDGNYYVIGPRYVLSTPFCGTEHEPELFCAPWGEERTPLSQFEGDASDDLAAEAIARQLRLGYIKAPFAFTGGNVLNDGVNTILSTEVLIAENRFQGQTPEAYFTNVAKATGMTNYIVLSDYEHFSLNHVDCFLKPLDERRLLVVRPPKDHELYPVYRDIVENEIPRCTNSYGDPWEVVPVDSGVVRSGEGIAAYVNSLILNDCVYVPMYGIPEDERALQQWRDAMPGYDVQGFTFEVADEPFAYNPDGLYGEVGWDPGDVLHCRTRAIWDPQMLHVDVPGPVGTPGAEGPVTVVANIHAYSARPLVAEKTNLCWRVSGGEFRAVPLKPGSAHDQYAADIPAQPAGTTVEYYVECGDESGRVNTSPHGAPKQFLSYVVA